MKKQPTLHRQLTLAFTCIGLALPAAWAQQAKTVPDKPVPESKPVTTVTEQAQTADETIQLSPFTVDATKDKGYFAENTLAGSRIKTNLGDLAASISVVTKQQMEDTASVDINDIFKYEASTEGSSTYQPSIIDRNTVKDSVAGYSLGNDGSTTTNAQSNRIRGLNAADAAINNYSTNNRIPFDEYNVQSIEISRGPNSLLFGLATPSGVVNTNTSKAELNRNTNSVSVRTDQNGSYRATLTFNRSLIANKLAIYGALLYDDRQFVRKPSRDLYRRQYGALTYRPFKNTTIRLFAENYQNDANRPNFFTPRDEVTPWIQAGRPYYDPVTRSATIPGAVTPPSWVNAFGTTVNPYLPTGNGQVIGPYVSSTLSPGYNATANSILGAAMGTATSPYYVPGLVALNTTQVLREINNGATVAFFQRSMPGFYAPAQTNPATSTPTAASLGWVAQDPRFLLADRLYTSSNFWPAPLPKINGSLQTLVPSTGVLTNNSYSTWNYADVTNKAIYDWTKYNTLQTNFARVKAANYNIEFEQQITSNLFFSAGWLRQDIDEVDNYTVNQLQGATLAVDTMKNNIDGTANPYFGLPYIMEGQGGGIDTFFSPQTDDNYRAMLMYDLDFTKNHNWTKWLGHHRLVGSYQEQDTKAATERWRNNYVGGDADALLRFTRNLTLSNQAMWSNSTLYRNYYMGNPGGPAGVVTHSSGFYGNQGWQGPVTTPVQVWNYTSGTTGAFQTDSLIEQTVFADNGSFRSQREVKGTQFGMQSYFWEDRIIGTFGSRQDTFRARRTTSGAITDINGNVLQPAMTVPQLYTNGFTGQINYNAVMSRYGIWQHYIGSTKTVGVAFRPFQNWPVIQRLGGEGSLLSQFIDGFTFYKNQSNNFNPPATYQTDLFFKPLPKPTGKDYSTGIGFSLFHNKLVGRVTWYETTNADERTTAAGTLLTRLQYGDTTLGIPWAQTVQRIHMAMAAGKNLNGLSDPNSMFQQTNWNTNTIYDVSSAAMVAQAYAMLQLPNLYYSGLNVGATQQSKSKGTEVQVTFNPTPNWTIKLTGSKDQASYTAVAPQYDAWKAVRMPVWTTIGVTDIPDFVDPNSSRAYSLRNFWNAYGYTSVALRENNNLDTSTQGYFNDVVESLVATAKALEGSVSPMQRIYHASLLTNYNFTHGRLKGFTVGGSQRWESKAAIGYYGKVGNPVTPQIINLSDTTRPVYGDNGNYYTDLWIAYNRKIASDKIVMSVRLNCNNAFENGHLVPTLVNLDGSPWAYRIIDPRQWILSLKFTF